VWGGASAMQPKNVDLLVEHTEKMLESELTGWVQQIQNALAELREKQVKEESGKEDNQGK
jgi:hypothetical protein